MKPRSLIFLVWFGVIVLGSRLPAAQPHTTEVELWIQEARAAERRFDPQTALEKLLQVEQRHPEDAHVLQAISRQYSDSTVSEPSAEKRRALSEKALIYSQRAHDLDPRNPVYTLSLAICYGKLGLYGSNQERVSNARLVRKYAEEALALNPSYDWAHHVLGRWHYEVTELGGTKRFFAGMLYGGLPKASLAEAAFHLEKAVELSPNIAAHHIELGYVLLAQGKTKEARLHFERGLALPSQDINDEACKRRARSAIASLP
ncbi:MAG TPA: hypothetical protein PLN52_05180 [Opitutaceae bacterium]|nr:hypothetical protein [Opitutaceae bacterium]